ncbi:MAG: peptidase [Gammaproteobacteria bacterium GWE2_42_36]|nr:MAG: peptidase [Gammaproteobacteria bacterium GWE2_42_36]HCU05808.1 site-2 protease family protein [Coxiellaceae bacterium]
MLEQTQLSLVQTICIYALPVLFAIVVHEVAHGWMASKFGDKTALLLGRLTLNPLKHIDLFGTIIIPLVLLMTGSGFIFGWAKPVPINPRNFRNPTKAMPWVAAAGPLANLIMALLWAIIAKGGLLLLHQQLSFALPIVLMGRIGIDINLVLMLLNLIPIPPLDGSRILMAFLPKQAQYRYARLEPYGLILVLILLMTGLLSSIVWPGITILQSLIYTLFGLY